MQDAHLEAVLDKVVADQRGQHHLVLDDQDLLSHERASARRLLLRFRDAEPLV